MSVTERERDVLERSVHAVAERARDAYALVEELQEAGFGGDHPLALAAKRLRMELLQTKGDLERELLKWVVDCARCQRTVHWFEGVGPHPGSRRGRAGLPAGVEGVAADIMDPEQARRACSGAAVAYHAAQPAYTRWVQEFPAMNSSVAQGAATAGAKLLVADNLYMYAPSTEPLTEDSPLTVTGKKGPLRARMRCTARSLARADVADLGFSSPFCGCFWESRQPQRPADQGKRVPSRLASLGRRMVPSSRPTALTRAFGPPPGLRA